MSLPLHKIEPEYTTFAKKMRLARRRQQLTQEDLSKLIGRARCKVSYIERHYKRVMLHDAVKIAKELGISLDSMFELDENTVHHDYPGNWSGK